MRLSRVDLPALGRPRNETNPDFMPDASPGFDPHLLVFRFTPPRADLGDASPLDLEHLHREIVHVERLADVRHAPEVRQQVAAECLEALALDAHAEAVG